MEFLTSRVGHGISNVHRLGSGEWSTAYGFENLGAAYVVRFGNFIEDFEKDRQASRYAAADLPIPSVLDIGTTTNDGYYAISERMPGRTLDSIDEAEMTATLPSLLGTFDAIANSDISTTHGFGSWNAAGSGSRPSWRQALLDVGRDEPGDRTSGWRQRLGETSAGIEIFDEGFRQLQQLVGACPEERRLVHSDLLNHNVLVDNKRVSAVLDWGSSKYGDSLYDAAWLSFWWPWYTQWNDIDIDAALLKHFARTENADQRLQCYRLHVGLEGMAYEAFAGHWDELTWTTRRTFALLEEHGEATR